MVSTNMERGLDAADGGFGHSDRAIWVKPRLQSILLNETQGGSFSVGFEAAPEYNAS